MQSLQTFTLWLTETNLGRWMDSHMVSFLSQGFAYKGGFVCATCLILLKRGFLCHREAQSLTEFCGRALHLAPEVYEKSRKTRDFLRIWLVIFQRLWNLEFCREKALARHCIAKTENVWNTLVWAIVCDWWVFWWRGRHLRPGHSPSRLRLGQGCLRAHFGEQFIST